MSLLNKQTMFWGSTIITMSGIVDLSIYMWMSLSTHARKQREETVVQNDNMSLLIFHLHEKSIYVGTYVYEDEPLAQSLVCLHKITNREQHIWE